VRDRRNWKAFVYPGCRTDGTAVSWDRHQQDTRLRPGGRPWPHFTTARGPQDRRIGLQCRAPQIALAPQEVFGTTRFPNDPQASPLQVLLSPFAASGLQSDRFAGVLGGVLCRCAQGYAAPRYRVTPGPKIRRQADPTLRVKPRGSLSLQVLSSAWASKDQQPARNRPVLDKDRHLHGNIIRDKVKHAPVPIGIQRQRKSSSGPSPYPEHEAKVRPNPV